MAKKNPPFETPVTTTLKWFWFDQSNPGGKYVEVRVPGHRTGVQDVVVQAPSAAQANEVFRFRNFGSFDDHPCECCSVRWVEASNEYPVEEDFYLLEASHVSAMLDAYEMGAPVVTRKTKDVPRTVFVPWTADQG